MSAPDGTNLRTSRKSFLRFKSLPMSDIGSHTCILAGNHIANARRARQPIHPVTKRSRWRCSTASRPAHGACRAPKWGHSPKSWGNGGNIPLFPGLGECVGMGGMPILPLKWRHLPLKTCHLPLKTGLIPLFPFWRPKESFLFPPLGEWPPGE